MRLLGTRPPEQSEEAISYASSTERLARLPPGASCRRFGYFFWRPRFWLACRPHLRALRCPDRTALLPRACAVLFCAVRSAGNRWIQVELAGYRAEGACANCPALMMPPCRTAMNRLRSSRIEM